MTPAEQLRAAKALIDAPEKWTRGADARDALGLEVPPDSPDAVCFCARGALFRATGHRSERHVERVARGRGPLTMFNDIGAEHADIMKLFDDAIALAEAGQ